MNYYPLKDQTINAIIETEGGYSNNPDDLGGPTRFGITAKKAAEYGWVHDMIEFPRSLAVKIYEAEYWYGVKANLIEALSRDVVIEIVDTGVNMGTGRAGRFLQRSLNAFNNKQKLYNDISVDGIIGGGTIHALKSYLDVRDEKVLVTALNSLQGAKYIELVERREANETFVYGWFKNRVVI